jgi:hypothetical protein
LEHADFVNPANLSVIQRAALSSFEALGLPKGISILDAPCGDGSLAAALRQAGYRAPNIVGLRSRVRFFGSGFYHRDSRPLRETERNPFHHIALGTLADLRYALHTSGFRLASVGHTHIRPISFLYAWLVPWMWLYTAMAFRKEKDDVQRRANREVRSALFSKSVLFGENLLLIANRAK